ncbi:MAG: ABC transporter ATP-binding protein [candidate division Zixibacteria bacterium]|nr:ABC transporter ATP-binding protein [candidate division Zixibacteria bacterium]NIR68064.1 ABC transporter ATP-binding protein [candidate division Zixibacteria bacterium]NIS16848.1 ABC transporter ATP-binding protein [candidate division Zixibacteria bacterium]NIS49283.1 ABC transporter ATP-binding protein [candidate division Zixibacteria bacterium]NIT53250.1 ABC transporter ATP-binding protein [candidate division Zixibacteria bacterium]
MSDHQYFEDDALGKAYDSQLMKRLLQYVKPYKKWIVLALAILIISTLLRLAGPVIIKLAIDEYIAVGDADGLGRLALLYAGILLVQFVATWGQIYLMEWIGQKAMYDLRMKVFRHVQGLTMDFYDRNPVGRIITRVTSDINSLNELFSSGVVNIIGDLFTIFGIVAVMFVINSKLAAITLVALPLLIAATIIFRIKVRHAYREIRRLIAKLNAFVQEHVSGVSVVQNFVQERKIFNRFDEINKELMGRHHKSIIYYAVFFPTVEIISAISLGIIIWYGGGQVIQGAMTFGTLVAFSQYMEMFYRPIRDLSEKYNILQSAMASSERVFKLLDTKPAFETPVRPVETDGLKGEIKFKDIWFAYNKDEWVLKDINLDICAGEKVAFVGATGSGKTSMTNLILRFYDYQKGSITLDGKELKHFDGETIRKNISLVLQDVFLFSGTIEDNIRLGNGDISREQIRKAAEDVNLLRLGNGLRRGLETNVGERGGLLSVGQRQLVSFARALAYNPRILILDEATSSVDTETEVIIQKATETLMKGRTSIIIAHRLSTIKQVDKIVVIHKGRIREIGSHEDLLAQKGIYYNLYQLQYKDQELPAAV